MIFQGNRFYICCPFFVGCWGTVLCGLCHGRIGAGRQIAKLQIPSPQSPVPSLIPQLNILKNISKVRTNLRAAVHAMNFRVALASGR